MCCFSASVRPEAAGEFFLLLFIKLLYFYTCLDLICPLFDLQPFSFFSLVLYNSTTFYIPLKCSTVSILQCPLFPIHPLPQNSGLVLTSAKLSSLTNLNFVNEFNLSLHSTPLSHYPQHCLIWYN